ncbi:hypothetical protein CURE108131_11965 [Cupriavidus respiraculi]
MAADGGRSSGRGDVPKGRPAAPAARVQDGRFIWQDVGCAPTEASMTASVFQP